MGAEASCAPPFADLPTLCGGHVDLIGAPNVGAGTGTGRVINMTCSSIQRVST